MIRKIFINTFFSLSSAFLALACTIYMAKNLDGLSYSALSFCILIVNSAALLNIFKPAIFSLAKNKILNAYEIRKIISSSLILSFILLFVSFFIFIKNNSLIVSLFFSISSVLSFYSSIISDEIEASGNVVYSSLIRNLFWIYVYSSLFFVVLMSKDDFLFKSSIIIMAGFLLLNLILLKASRNISLKNIKFSLNKKLILHIKDNSKISIFNISSIILGSADRIFLSFFFGRTEFFHFYSIISDLFVKGHIFFRVISSVCLSELATEKITEKKLREKVIFFLSFLFLMVLVLLFFMDIFLELFNIKNILSYKIAIFYASAIIPVGAGYLSSAIAYSRGDSRAFVISYFPISLLFLISNYIICKFGSYQEVVIVYFLSRLSDFFLMKNVGFGRVNIIYTITLMVTSLLIGWMIWM